MVHYEIRASENLVTVRMEGAVTDAELGDAYRALYSDPAWRPGMSEYVDVRGADGVAVTPFGLREIASITENALAGFTGVAKTAIVVSQDVGYGMARMYQAYSDASPETVQVFRDPQEAWRWLGHEPPAPGTTARAGT